MNGADGSTLGSSIDYRLQGKSIEDILNERERQSDKWGNQYHLSEHQYLAILAEEFGEAAKEVVEHNSRNLYVELVQVAAVAVAWLEKLRAEGVDGT